MPLVMVCGDDDRFHINNMKANKVELAFAWELTALSSYWVIRYQYLEMAWKQVGQNIC